MKTHLDAVYASLPDSPGQAVHQEQTKGISKERRHLPLLRRTAIAAASAVVFSTSLFASGFVPPAMADTIREIPVIGSLFSKIEGDAGLRTAGERHQGTLVNSAVQSGIVIKPYIRENGLSEDQKQYLDDLEIKIDLNASK